MKTLDQIFLTLLISIFLFLLIKFFGKKSFQELKSHEIKKSGGFLGIAVLFILIWLFLQIFIF